MKNIKNSFLSKGSMKIFLIFSLVLIFFIILSSSSAVDIKLTSNNSSGIVGAIDIIKNSNDTYNTITLESGTYKGVNNRNINISFSNKTLIIKGIGEVILDAENLGNHFQIGRCPANDSPTYDPATYVSGNNITFENIVFVNGSGRLNIDETLYSIVKGTDMEDYFVNKNIIAGSLEICGTNNVVFKKCKFANNMPMI